jgi:hypothetical protein
MARGPLLFEKEHTMSDNFDWKALARKAADWATSARMSDHRGICNLSEIPASLIGLKPGQSHGIIMCFANLGDDDQEMQALIAELKEWGHDVVDWSRSTPDANDPDGYSWVVFTRATDAEANAAWRLVVKAFSDAGRPVRGQLWNLGQFDRHE